MSLYKNVLAVMVLIFTFTFVDKSHGEETWKIASLNWQPYSGAEMTNQGNSVLKLRELLKKEGIRLVVEYYPWKRAQKLAETEEYVGYFPAWPEEVVDGFVGSSPVDWSEIGLIKALGSDVEFKNIDQLFKDYNVGVVSTYVYSKEIEDAMKKYPNHVDKAPNEVALLKKLSGGRHPVAITDPNVMIYLAEKEGIMNIEAMNHIIEKKELVISLRNDEENSGRIKLLEKLLKQK